MSKLQQAHDRLRAAEQARQLAADRFYAIPGIKTRANHAKACRVVDECAAEYFEQLRERSRRSDYWIRTVLLTLGTTAGTTAALYYLTH